jgi:hypothetical protein
MDLKLALLMRNSSSLKPNGVRRSPKLERQT